MKVITKLFLILLIYIINCPAQNLVNIFKDNLPLNIIKEKSELKNISDNLNYYSSIHPDLIFYYIRYLNNLITHKIKSPDKNGLKELYALRDYYLLQRNRWLENQINKIESKNFIRIKNNAMINCFDDHIEDMDNAELEVKLNVNDSTEYFNYKFFTQRSNVAYNTFTDYYKLNFEILDSTVQSINKKLNHLSELNNEKTLEVLNEIIGNWYLFTNDENEKYKFSLVTEPYELSIKVYINEFNESSGVLVSGEYYYFENKYDLFDGSLEFQDYVLPTFTNPIKFSFPIKITQTPLFSFAFGYKFKLKQELGFLSSLKIKASYTYLNSKIEFVGANEEFYRFNYNIITGDSIESFIYYVTDFNEMKNYYFSFQITSPIFFWYKSLFVELGISFDYYAYEYSADVYRENALVYGPTNSKIVRSTENRGELLVEGSNFYLTPALLINYSPSNDWNIFTGLYWNKDFPRISLGIAYDF